MSEFLSSKFSYRHEVSENIRAELYFEASKDQCIHCQSKLQTSLPASPPQGQQQPATALALQNQSINRTDDYRTSIKISAIKHHRNNCVSKSYNKSVTTSSSKQEIDLNVWDTNLSCSDNTQL